MVENNSYEKSFDFELLLTQYLDNNLNEEELAVFESQLCESEEYRYQFVTTCRIAGSIRECVALCDKDFPSDSTKSFFGFLGDYLPMLGNGFGGTVTLTIALIAVTLACFALWGGNGSSLDEPVTVKRLAAPADNPSVGMELLRDSMPTARLIETADCLWESDPLQIGDSIEVGRRIQLKSGLAKIAFTDRAEVILEGPAEFAVVSETAAELCYGRISADVFDAGKGFTIDAPGMRVLDLGTQFGFSVEPDGQGEVHVFKGEVAVKLKKKDGHATHSRLLTTHRAASIDSRKGRIDTLRYDPSRFIRTFEPSDLEITREYVEAIKAATPVAYWRFEYLRDDCVMNEMSDRYRGSSPMRLVLSEDVQNKALAVEQRSLTKPYMTVTEPIQELAGSSYSIECWIKSDGYQWITPAMLYFPDEKTGEFTSVTALIELLPQKGNQWEPHARVVRGLHRFPASGIYGDGVDCYSEEEYEPNRWTHLVLVNGEDELRIYVNGRLAAKKPITGRIKRAPTLSIGRFNEFIFPERRASDREMAGQIDEVAIYNRCLDEQEIKEHYRLGTEMQPEPLLIDSTQGQ